MFFTATEFGNLLNELGKKIVDFVMNYFYKLPEIYQALAILGIALLSLIGLISLFKWSMKVVIPLAILAILGILIWKFVL